MAKEGKMNIYCCGCKEKIDAVLTSGREIYPHRKDLYSLKFWKCPACKNYVGCHNNGTGMSPLGNIPTKELREKRKQIHAILDPLWKSGRFRRKALYSRLSELLGWNYHTAKIRSIEEAETVLEILKSDPETNNSKRIKGE
jgi:hypothetical protein